MVILRCPLRRVRSAGHFLRIHQHLRLEHPFLFIGVDELLQYAAEFETRGLCHLAGITHLPKSLAPIWVRRLAATQLLFSDFATPMAASTIIFPLKRSINLFLAQLLRLLLDQCHFLCVEIYIRFTKSLPISFFQGLE